MKTAKISLVVLYGALLTYATVIAIGFGNAFSGWGDGTANNVRHTSFWCAWPTAIYFAAAATSLLTHSYSIRKFIFVTATVVLFFGFMGGTSHDDAIFLSVAVVLLSLLVWIPILLVPKEGNDNRDNEKSA